MTVIIFITHLHQVKLLQVVTGEGSPGEHYEVDGNFQKPLEGRAKGHCSHPTVGEKGK